MICYFVSRHAGAIEWIAGQSVRIDETVAHLDLERVRSGDTVVGTLPAHLAAEVCRRGARYLHLIIDMPAQARGRELDTEAMVRHGARLEEYVVQRRLP